MAVEIIRSNVTLEGSRPSFAQLCEQLKEMLEVAHGTRKPNEILQNWAIDGLSELAKQAYLDGYPLDVVRKLNQTASICPEDKLCELQKYMNSVLGGHG